MQYQGESDGEFLFCKVSDMNLPGNEVEIHTTVHKIDADVMKKIRARANPVGTVIFPKIGGAIATHKRRLIIKPTIIDNNCSGIQPIGLTDDRWLLLLMRSLDLTKYQSGTSVPAVSQGSLDPIRIGLPPLAEQRRIVAKVNELMALCDRLETQQQGRETRHAALARASLARFADAPTPANLNFLFHPSYAITPTDLRKSILTIAIQGKLVPQNPNDEPAQSAVTQIEKERERLISAKQFRRSKLPGPINEGPFNIPETWVWTHLGNAMLNVTDGFHSTPKTVESGVRYVTAKHVKPGLIDFDSCLYVSEGDFKEIASKTRPRKGDVLVVNIGAGSGLASIIEVDFEFAFKNVAILNRPEEVDSKFLFYYLAFKRDEIFEEQTKGGAQPFLSLGLIRQIPFPLPPLAEQRRIVAKVEQLMALVDALETQLAASRATAANLLSALVAEISAPKRDDDEI
jgi:type I restriction enzyme S subunit